MAVMATACGYIRFFVRYRERVLGLFLLSMFCWSVGRVSLLLFIFLVLWHGGVIAGVSLLVAWFTGPFLHCGGKEMWMACCILSARRVGYLGPAYVRAWPALLELGVR